MMIKNFTIHHFNEIPSSNDLALKLLKENQITHNHIITAKSQNAGRGRLDRHWSSPPGNLYFSLIVRPEKFHERVSDLSFLAAISLNESLRKISPKNLEIQNKWPNDILINGKKTAGILLQKYQDYIIIGIGLNLISHPEQTIFPASNLAEFSLEILPENALENFLHSFSDFYQKWQNFGFTPIRNIWLQNAYKINKEISLNLGEEKINGILQEIDTAGNLILQTAQNTKEVIKTADIL